MLCFFKYRIFINRMVKLIHSTKSSHQFFSIFLVDCYSISSQFLVNFLVKYLVSFWEILFTGFLVNFQSILNQIFSELVVNFIFLTKISYQFFSQFLVNYLSIFNEIFSALLVNFIRLRKSSYQFFSQFLVKFLMKYLVTQWQIFFI